MKTAQTWWTVLLCLFATSVSASSLTIDDQQKQYQDSLNWAQSAQQNILSRADGQLSVSDYCADAACVNEVNHPPQSTLSDSAIDDSKTTAFFSDDTAAAMQDNFNKGRPDISKDPAYDYALIGQENAYNITHGISNQYVDCNTGSQCVTEQQATTCNVSTLNPVSCYETPYVQEQTVTSGSVSFIYSGFTPVNYTLPQGVTHITGITFPYVLTCQKLNCYLNKGSHFRVNGSVVHSEPYPTPSSNFAPEQQRVLCLQGGDGGWCFSRYWPFTVPLNMPVNGSLTIDFLNDYGLYLGTFTVYFKRKTNTIGWRSDCSALASQCEQQEKQCIEGPETRMLNGVPTYLECWKYQIINQCDFGDTCDQISACRETSRQCSLLIDGVCVQEEVSALCDTQRCSATNLQCGETSFCLDGDCYQPLPQTSDDFNQSASALAALADAADGIGDPPRIFSGKGFKCTDAAFGFADCCKDSGWGTDLGIAECNEEEKALGQAKEQGITVYLGKYCASDTFGICTRKKKTYCVYDSKLARIVQEQGVRDQLGISLGSAENPLCGPITPEQLEQINFEYIDFSDFYQDMNDGTQFPSAEEIQDRLQSAYGD